MKIIPKIKITNKPFFYAQYDVDDFTITIDSTRNIFYFMFVFLHEYCHHLVNLFSIIFRISRVNRLQWYVDASYLCLFFRLPKSYEWKRAYSWYGYCKTGYNHHK